MLLTEFRDFRREVRDFLRYMCSEQRRRVILWQAQHKAAHDKKESELRCTSTAPANRRPQKRRR